MSHLGTLKPHSFLISTDQTTLLLSAACPPHPLNAWWWPMHLGLLLLHGCCQLIIRLTPLNVQVSSAMHSRLLPSIAPPLSPPAHPCRATTLSRCSLAQAGLRAISNAMKESVVGLEGTAYCCCYTALLLEEQLSPSLVIRFIASCPTCSVSP